MTKKQSSVDTTTRVEVYDTTLRDGSQGEAVKFSPLEMVQVAEKLASVGVDYVEGGFPFSNPRDEEFFRLVRTVGPALGPTKVVAFGLTWQKKKVPELARDGGLRALLAAKTPVVCLVAKASVAQVTGVLDLTSDEYLDVVAKSVEFLKAERPDLEVFLDAEHFFDGYRADKKFAVELLRVAREAGATRLVLCDTNGGSLPGHVAAVTAEVRAAVADGHPGVALGIHAHNDGELAVANTLAAVESGARQVQVTVNGFGERCGNADFISVVANLGLKMGYPVLRPDAFPRLAEVSRFVYDRANLPYRSSQPFVGDSAFAHKGGMHVSAIRKDPAHYEHLQPEAVGNRRRVLISDLSGRSSVLEKLARFGLKDLDKEVLVKLVERIEALELEGWQFDSADASFYLLALELLGRRKRRFDVQHYTVLVRDKATGLPEDEQVEASVKVRVGRDMRFVVREGCGPVNALDLALREALELTYPELATVKLTDYSVRLIPDQNGQMVGGSTSNRVRVLIKMQDQEGNMWGTVAVAKNIVAASYKALVDAFDYKCLLDAKKVWNPA